MKKLFAWITAAALMASCLTGCGSSAASGGTAAGSEPASVETAAATETAPQEAPAASQPEQSSETPEESSVPEEPSVLETEENYEPVDISVGTIKGPTGIGMVKLMADSDAGLTDNNYTFTLAADASEIVSKVIAGEYDIACVPTNSAAVLYQKTQGAVKLLALNTAGVLHILQNTENSEPITDWEQLKGKTIYTVGQGANPEYVLDYVLSGHGIDPEQDVEIVFCAAADEVVAACATGEADLCMLPEPAVSALQAKVTGFNEIFDMTDAWNEVATDGSILTQGCVVVQTAFLEAHPDAVAHFLKEYEAAIDYVQANPDEAASLMVQYEIVASEAIAKSALPGCHVMFAAGQEMKDSISGYYQVLFDADPTSVGGSLPDDAFYVINQ